MYKRQVGSLPIAITNCLNFGNPEKDKIMGQFVETVDGISQACNYLDFPVVSGNVSFYNETQNKAISPTPTIGGIGLIKNLDQEEVKVRILHQGVGGISKSDVQLANASGGVVFGFNVRANKQAMELSEAEGVDIRYYSVIYDLAEDIKGLVIGLMKPEKRESFLGNAEIREVFRVSKLGNVAGCFVVDGSVKRGAGVRLIRDDVVIHEGSLSTLKRFKDDVREVQQNYECGMSFENYDDIKIGDVIECFEVEEFAPQI